MDLVVDPAPDGVKLPGTGYTSGSLQDNITISNDKGLIGGHLKYTTGMVTMYSNDRLKQEGNFIALWLHEIGDPYVNYDKIEAKVVNGEDEKELEVSDEGYICFRVDDRLTTKLVVTVTIGEQTYEKEFKLTSLTVDEYGWNILKGTNPTGDDLYQWAEYKPTNYGVSYPDIYADDSTKKYFMRTSPDSFEELEEQGYEVKNEMINDSTGIGNEWIKTQFKITHSGDKVPSSEFNIYSGYLPLKPSTKYTLSYYEKGEIPLKITVPVRNKEYRFTKNYVFVNPTQHSCSSTSFSRYEVSFTTDSDMTDQIVTLCISISPVDEWAKENWTMIVAGLKLEEGDHATGWDDYWSGDNLLLDTDQPDFDDRNPNIIGGDQSRRYRLLDHNGNSSLNIEFIKDEELPAPGLLINNKYVFHKPSSDGSTYYNFTFGNEFRAISKNYNFKNGDPVTFSVYVKARQNNYSGNVSFILSGSKGSGIGTFFSLQYNSLKANEWTRFVYTSVFDEGVKNTNFNNDLIVSNHRFDDADDLTIEFCGFKLEKGCHVTDYRPAPTDFNINYILNSGEEATNSNYLIKSYMFISSISSISNDIPLMATIYGSYGDGKQGFVLYGHYENPRFGAQVPFGGVSVAEPDYPPNMGNPLAKKYICKFKIPSKEKYPNYIKDTSVLAGVNVFVPPDSLTVDSTISKLKVEVGRYPTKWVDGTGDPAYVASDDEGDDYEVT